LPLGRWPIRRWLRTTGEGPTSMTNAQRRRNSRRDDNW
jgi:hypothetical protein